MKINIFKYVFFLIIIILIFVSIYILYNDSRQDYNGIKANKIELNINNEINIGITNFDTINPLLSNNRDVQYIDKLIFQSLLDISCDFKIENLLAKEFSKINEKTYIIKLKEDVYWHDGINFTAKDVLFTINNLKNDKINSIYKENVNEIEKIEQIDDYTLKITLFQEVPFFEYKMCFPILASHSYEEGTLNSKSKNPIGTGKYKIANIGEENIKLILNQDKDIKIKKINIVLKNNIKELYNAFSKNEIDYMITDNINYEEYIGTMGYNVTETANREYEYLIFNNENSILSSKKIRKAINYAIDRKAINYNVYNNKYVISQFPLSYGSYLYNKSEMSQCDINEAKQNIREDGWTYKNNQWIKKNKKLELNIIVNDKNKKRILLAEEIKKQLREIGIDINIIESSDNNYKSYIKNKKYDMILTGNIVSICPDLQTYLGKENIANFKNNEAEKILKDIININDEKILLEKYYELEEIYKEETPFVSLYFNTIFVLSGTDLKGDLSFNWYNLFYNIDNWYKIK